MEAAKVLFETVASVLNRSARSAISLEANFYELGGNSLNSIVTISQLNEKGYRISIGDFIAAIDLGEVLERMLSGLLSNMQAPRFTSELCKPEHRDVVIQIITDSFYHKADLEQWILSEISPNDYRKYLTDLWEPLVDKRLSFVVRNDFGKIVAVAINFDYRDEPEVEIDSRLSLIFEYLEDLEATFRDSRIPMGKGKTIHCHMMGTHSSLTPKENVHIIKFMEDEVYRLAKHRHFGGILTTNTNPLTQQLAINVLKFETWLDSQVNEFVNSDGRRPFGLAPDSQRALLQWKAIE